LQTADGGQERLDAEKNRFEAKSKEEGEAQSGAVKMDIQIGGSSGSGFKRGLEKEEARAEEEKSAEMEVEEDKPKEREVSAEEVWEELVSQLKREKLKSRCPRPRKTTRRAWTST
jgi:hypothetical protein